MPLDRTNGELVGDLGKGFRIVPVQKWRDTFLWDDAVRRARQAFKKAGALLPIHIGDDSILVQEYPTQDRIAFIFERRVAGKERLFPAVYRMNAAMKEQLVQTGRWERQN